MNKTDDIDYSKLFGFESLGNGISGSVDFRDETVAAKLGAKLGDPINLQSADPSEE